MVVAFRSTKCTLRSVLLTIWLLVIASIAKSQNEGVDGEQALLSPDMEELIHNGYIRVDVAMRNASRAQGDTIKLNCEMTGDPKPRYAWLKDDKPLVKDPRVTIKSTYWGHRLIIRDVLPRDAGQYTCVGVNTFGQMNTSMFLRVTPPRPDSDPTGSRTEKNQIGSTNYETEAEAESEETLWKALEFADFQSRGFCQPFAATFCGSVLQGQLLVSTPRQNLIDRARALESLFRAVTKMDTSSWRCTLPMLFSTICLYAFPTCTSISRVVRPLCAADCRQITDNTCRAEIADVRAQLAEDFDASFLLDCSRLPNTSTCNSIDFSAPAPQATPASTNVYKVVTEAAVADFATNASARVSSESSDLLVIAIPCVLVALLLMVASVMLTMHLKKRGQRRRKMLQISATKSSSFRPIVPSPIPFTGMAMYSSDQVCVLEELGSGPCWTLRNGFVQGPPRNSSFGAISDSHNEFRRVFLKVLKDEMNVRMQQDFYREATLINELDHPNVLTSIGICKSPWMIVFEHVEGVDLKQLLLRNRDRNTLSSDKLCDLARQVASGLGFLASRNLVHRDVAARNVLVDSNLRAKLNDLGVANPQYSHEYLCTSRLLPSGALSTSLLPIRWMAPESLDSASFSSQSDVWSFGVTVWEIFSLGDTPYAAYADGDVPHLVLKGGAPHALSCPCTCPRTVYALLTTCWNIRADLRPSLGEVESQLTSICGDVSNVSAASTALKMTQSQSYRMPHKVQQFPSFSEASMLQSCSNCQPDDEQARCLIHSGTYGASHWNQLSCPPTQDTRSRISSRSGSERSNRSSALRKQAASEHSNAASGRSAPLFGKLTQADTLPYLHPHAHAHAHALAHSTSAFPVNTLATPRIATLSLSNNNNNRSQLLRL